MAEAKPVIGWREWVELPDLGIRRIKAKVDTGARSSALHAYELEPYHERGVAMVRFAIHPLQRRTDISRECFAEVIDKRWVSDSGGHREKRIVIVTAVHLGDYHFNAEITLTNRDTMKFRMLLGRTALQEHFLVDPSVSYRFGKPVKHKPR